MAQTQFENLKFIATGEADYCVASLTGYFQGTSVEWNVYLPIQESTDVKLIKFPTQFLNEVNLTFLENLEFSSFTFVDEKDLGSYNDLIVKELRKAFVESPHHAVPELASSASFKIR